MPEPTEVLRDPYLVRDGDTLAGIAKRADRSVKDLQRLNGLANPHRLNVGQTLYLSERTAFGFSAVFLDALRCPISNLPFRCEYDGRTVIGVTDESGRIAHQITRSAASQVAVWVRTVEGNWTCLVDAVSGHGHKLLSFVSDALVVDGRTEAHPPSAPTRLPEPTNPAATPSKTQPTAPRPAQGTAAKNNRNVKKRPAKGPQGQPVIEVSVDLPAGLMALFAWYEGGSIGDDEWEIIADGLSCEPAVLRAIARVESGGRSSFWRLNSRDGAQIPALVFERHYFSRLTQGKYDNGHPDIAWPRSYRKNAELGSRNMLMHDGTVDADDVYGNYARGYLRLINAYRLAPEAALKSCSWGKFQIMGENHKLCGYDFVDNFVREACISEHAQIKLLAAFIRRKAPAWKNPKNKALGKEISLWDAVKIKNWAALAFNYNGPDYKTYRYDEMLRAAYEEYSKT
ncbi:N-acetylmuramidase domain-containing protein [Azoarcus sp. DN11]|uniref:LysM peptidoglycan-binding domain-containing protein n=1 Tax=Azoarcus sp. DN11 TaxID=356837 RepID=UPI0013E2EB9C|nr:N-acetylmuramidase domain-containing protein [Azoarcus sp. DN11]